MCLCPVIYEVNSTRKLSDVYSLDMIMSENGGRFHSSRGRRSGPNRGRGNSFQSFSTTTGQQGVNRPICQICEKPGHLAKDCWYSFNKTYGNSPQVNIAEPVPMPCEGGFIDSGASSHITPDLNALSSHAPYQGSEEVKVGNGAGLCISNLGATQNSRALNLSNVLHVPSMTKNLDSISRLTKDNNVIAGLNSYSFFIQDATTNEVLLEGSPHDGLYHLPPPVSLLSEATCGSL